MRDPILSIIIPVYNCEAYLAAAITSILKQPNKNFEIIIVDDGSKDASGTIADRFSAQYENVQSFHIPNSGVSAARNLGIQKAKGQYIGFLDADDVLCKDVYTNELCSALAEGIYDIVSFSYFVSTENLQFGRSHLAIAGLFPRNHENYLRQTLKHFSSYLYRRNMFTENIRFPEGFRFSEDVAFLFLISRNAGHIMQYSQHWFIHRMNASSVMHSINSSDHILNDMIGVWEWCKAQCITDEDRNACNGNIFLNMIEYIQSSCAYNVDVNTILHNVNHNEPFKKAMENYGHFWVSPEYADLYREFLQNPHRIWRKYRVIGLLHNLARRLSWTALGNAINRVFRYRQPLAEFVP